MKKTVKTKKPGKSTKVAQSAPGLIRREQWLIVALLVVVLFAFACFVYGADVMWSSNHAR